MGNRLLIALEDEALNQIDEIRQIRERRGDAEQLKRAKVAIGLIGSCVRLRATLANEETNRLVALRVERDLLPSGS